ncbi:MAG: hypothetical protein E7631_01260 [Ruminococcaceae bacterium]|nr:hypothetical protein [Oscillospiraceae bacterium]
MEQQPFLRNHVFSDRVRSILMPFCRLLSRRKATGFFLLYCITGCLLAYSTFFFRILLLILSGVLITGVLLIACRKRFWYAVLLPVLLGIFCGTGSSLLLFDGYAGQYEDLAKQEAVVAVRGEVTDVVYTNAYSGRYICRITGDGLPYSVVVSSESPSFQVGQILTGDIVFRRWEDTDDGFDEKQYYMGRSVVAAAEDISLRETGESRLRLSTFIQNWNHSLSAKISAHVRNDGLPTTMLLGNRDTLSDTIQRDFRRLGILHLLAVSGTHFSMLSAMAERLLIRFRVRPQHRCWVLGILSVFYMLLTGMSASVRRAGLMFLISLLCRSLELKVRYFSSLNIACGLILLLDPFAVLDMGLHLSYLAICGCILTIHLEKNWSAYRRLWKTPVRLDENGKRLPSPRGWRLYLSPRYLAGRATSMLLLNLIVTCLTLPLSWLYFGEMSLLSLVSNLFYIPASGLLLFLTLVYLCLYPLGLFTVPLAALLSAYAAFLELPASLLSSLPHVSVSLGYPFIPFFMLPLVLSVCTLPLQKRKFRGLLCVFCLLLAMNSAVLVYETAAADQTVLVYRSDRTKEGFVVRSAGEVLLIDVSDGSYNFTSQLLAEAKELYATEIGGYMVTHYHNRHAGTFRKLSDNWIVRKLYLPEPVTEEEEAVFLSLQEAATEKGIETVLFRRETVFGHFSLCTGERVYLSRSSHPVSGFVMEAGGETMVYGSSSFAEGDPEILRRMTEADLCIFGAHSPVTKKTFALPLVRQPKVIIWNGDSVTYFEGTFPAAQLDLFSCTRFLYRFPDATVPADAGYTAPRSPETP